jgi:hypothetical protein
MSVCVAGRADLTASTFKVKQSVALRPVAASGATRPTARYHISEDFLLRMIRNASFSAQHQAVQMLLYLQLDGVVTYTATG